MCLTISYLIAFSLKVNIRLNMTIIYRLIHNKQNINIIKRNVKWFKDFDDLKKQLFHWKVNKYRKYRCDCNDWNWRQKRFSFISHLNYDKKWHSGQKHFVCNYENCSKAFNKRDRLKQHLLTHSGIKNLKCLHIGCDQLYYKWNHLKRHILIDSNFKDINVITRNAIKNFTIHMN
jgi:uncharacterized Zn-finger protein